MSMFRFFIYYILLFPLVFSNVYAQDQKAKVYKIAAGGVLEGYYFIGLKLCKYISEANQNIRCEVVPTTGTIENIRLLQDGKVDFAFAQSNLALDAYKGKGYFAKSPPFTNIIQLLRLHEEAFTVIAKDKDKILVFGDIEGKKISNGPPNSDSSLMYDKLISYYNFEKEPQDINVMHEEYAKQFCENKIDAIILMSGHPNALVNYITNACESDFVSIESDKIDMFIADNPTFKKYIIEEGGYPGITKAENTVSVPAIFITNDKIPKEVITNFMTYFKARIDQFKLSSPLLYNLDNNQFNSEFILPGLEPK